MDDDANVDEDMMLGLLPDHLQERAQSIMGKCLPTCTYRIINIDRSETSTSKVFLFFKFPFSFSFSVAGSDNCNKIYNLAKCVQESAPDVSAKLLLLLLLFL